MKINVTLIGLVEVEVLGTCFRSLELLKVDLRLHLQIRSLKNFEQNEDEFKQRQNYEV